MIEQIVMLYYMIEMLGVQLRHVNQRKNWIH